MTIKTINVSGRTIWLSIDQLRIYSADHNMTELKEEFLCYFKMSEPTPLILGELFRDENKKPLLFNSIDLATEYATNELGKRLK